MMPKTRVESENQCGTRRKKPLLRLEDVNKKTFLAFKILGLFLIRWDEGEKCYRVRRIRFFLFYTFWFVWPMLGLFVAFLGKLIFHTATGPDDVNNVIESSLFILGFAVIPAIKTYSLKLVTKCLPDILEEIVSLQELDVGFETPLSVRIPSRPQKAVISNSASHMAYKKKSSSPEALFRTLPIVTLILSIVAFIVAWTYGLTEVVEWQAVKQEWPFFIMQFSYLTLPCISTWFSVIFIEWLRMVYKNMSLELQSQLCNVTNETIIYEDHVKVIGDYVDRLQDIFTSLSNGFLTYVVGINFFIIIVSAIFCTAKLLHGFHEIMYVIPLSISVFHMGLICKKSQELMDEHEMLTLAVKQYLRHSRKRPAALPYSELHVLRENLLEAPPQVVCFGGYRVGSGLMLAIHGFIISYAMLLNDVLQTQEENSSSGCNLTSEGQL
nr:uncharacterized protein LOC123763689 [Procambarus clarkii]XP_045606930.1 uncharacterized protein LOC123763689 [Procambarus clarkii]XP_045606931.1 uncharacterized protein LOC123763689 [Procambarus clarkii]XP_045606932.1 uncharacterized protein LOC123763689 [Procambarus clarkii]XP_045606933.1 uncharacterized protein LOC123763689 [Procambarus clarkii]